ncbi:hypothetical protein JRO89_XS02G0098200 [Xanthoceras sorbifolium]|uniref:Uncharacterized protein n=1 Tax=Xanthoceras sorbifolium TaxID=99658 RepID=A0ABQ8IGQ6_9ROSI|nr:hypothetical protein JRO89_XS02G0098200 [Xanthoceras sorbifolium]
MKTASLPMDGLRWAKVAITDIVVEITNHEQNLREPQSDAVSMFNNLTYMPQVNDDRKPNLHQEFVNLDNVHAFYNIYAKEAGFSVRLGYSKKIVDDKGSKEASKILKDDLNNVLSKVKSVVRSESISERHNSTPQIYNESLAVRAKGCGKRLKGGKEKTKGKTTDNSRRCNGCGKVNHEDFNKGIIQDEAKKKASLNS